MSRLLDLNIDNLNGKYNDSIDELKLLVINNMAEFFSQGFKGFDRKGNRLLNQEIYTILDSLDERTFLKSKVLFMRYMWAVGKLNVINGYRYEKIIPTLKIYLLDDGPAYQLTF